MGLLTPRAGHGQPCKPSNHQLQRGGGSSEPVLDLGSEWRESRPGRNKRGAEDGRDARCIRLRVHLHCFRLASPPGAQDTRRRHPSCDLQLPGARRGGERQERDGRG
eukprot:117927-Hanusia_phi.AAC.4